MSARGFAPHINHKLKEKFSSFFKKSKSIFVTRHSRSLP